MSFLHTSIVVAGGLGAVLGCTGVLSTKSACLTLAACCASSYFLKKISGKGSDSQEYRLKELTSPDSVGADVQYLKNERGESLLVRTWNCESGDKSLLYERVTGTFRELTPFHPADPKGLILVIHGFSWHSAYFVSLARVLNKIGLQVDWI